MAADRPASGTTFAGRPAIDGGGPGPHNGFAAAFVGRFFEMGAITVSTGTKKDGLRVRGPDPVSNRKH